MEPSMVTLPTTGTFLFIKPAGKEVITGTASGNGVKGGFEVSDYSFAASASADEQHILDFQDLQLSFTRGLHDPSLFEGFALGVHYTISLVTYGMDTSGGGMVVNDFTFETAIIGGVNDSNEPLQSLYFSYDRFTVTSTDSNQVSTTTGSAGRRSPSQQVGRPGHS
jgi:hypothetical protein